MLVKEFHKRLGNVKKISESAVRRPSLYLRPLRVVAGKQELISSQELAERSGSTSAQVRKDLSLSKLLGCEGERSHA